MDNLNTIELPESILSRNVTQGNLEFVKFLIEYCKYPTKWLNYSDVTSVVVNGYVDMFKFLLEKGIDHILSLDDGWFFVWAVSHNELDIAKLLVECGANYTTHYDTAMSSAIDHNNQEMLEYIQSLNVDRNKVKQHENIRLYYNTAVTYNM